MRSQLRFAYCLLLLSSSLACRELTGTVYSDHSGPSGNGTGVVEIRTATGVIPIYYQKPIKQSFRDNRCSEIGAIWTVQTQRGSLGSEELVGAQCDGKVDVQVHSAWMAVRDYIKTVAKRAGHESGFQPDRRHPVNVIMYGIEADLYGYLQFSPGGMCLDVKESVNKAIIIIEGSIDCYFVPDLDFTAKQTGPTAWSVTSIKAVQRE